MNRIRISAIAALVLAHCTATGAVAGETVEVALTQDGVLSSTSYPVIPDAHDLVFSVSEWGAPQPEDPASPLRGLHGRCFGTGEFRDDTIVAGGGYCTYADADGDRLVTRWSPKDQTLGPSPGAGGEWEVFEGSGKWEGATGSGIYWVTRTGSTGERRRTLTGSITLR